MTWNEFKQAVDEALMREDRDGDIELGIVDVSRGADGVCVEVEHGNDTGTEITVAGTHS